jgi:hypothetical protein
MKTISRIITFTISLFIISHVSAQDTVNYKTIFPSGIFAGYGLGSYSVKDEYISKEKYSGTLPYYNVAWVRFHDKHAYRLEFEYRNSSDISNNKISAKVGQFTFNQDFIYFIGNFSIFSRNIYAYLGPSLQFFYYDIYYNFADPGTYFSPKTFGLIASLGINTEFIYQLNNKLIVESFLHLNLISFTVKDNDEQKYGDESNPTLVSVFTATKFDFALSVRYYLLDKVSISLGYKFDFSRISKWEPYIAASDNFLTSLNYEF